MDRPYLRYFSFCFKFELMFFLIGRRGGGGEGSFVNRELSIVDC